MTNNDALSQASAWTRNYRNQNFGGIKGHCLPAETLQAILSQEGCVGVRAYYGLTDDNTPKLILVGYDTNDNDILSNTISAARSSVEAESVAGTSQVAIDLPPCPPCCSVENPINS
ncbi:hypothetical protein [Hymenobacter sp. DG01]|uniref:hypothetical protein n=1 Tax=Hymenobacter sp. DG01 TaxID=2584940 RepID=UPI00111D329B|nr:hypothetical protein [Hymenobacter sp. DG01]